VPFWNNIHHWVNFLNHDTPVLTGSERLTKKMNNGIFYLYMRRPRRGYYVADVKVITLDPRSMDDYQVTDAYFKLLEENIREAPQYWLWTHNRWKRTREEFNLRYDETTGRVDIISTVEELKKKKGLL
jgi:KDO2-lipid IV(A) lauroyltransferase